MILLVLSALVGVAGVVILVYKFRNRNLQKKKSVRREKNTDPSDVDVLERLEPLSENIIYNYEKI